MIFIERNDHYVARYKQADQQILDSVFDVEISIKFIYTLVIGKLIMMVFCTFHIGEIFHKSAATHNDLSHIQAKRQSLTNRINKQWKTLFGSH